MTHDNKAVTTLYRPVADAELKLIEATGLKRFPPRLPEQPIFYPFTNEAYAVQITCQWNVPAYGIGYVMQFDVDSAYINKYEIQNVSAEIHDELWVPAEDLEEFNDHIIALIKVIGTYT